MANQSGIAISITAFLVTGKTLDEQFAALSIVKEAHETGDYAKLLSSSVDVLVKTENKTRRVPAPSAEEIAKAQAEIDYAAGYKAGQAAEVYATASPPAFIKGYEAGYATRPEEEPAVVEANLAPVGDAVEPQPPAPVSKPELAAEPKAAKKKVAEADAIPA